MTRAFLLPARSPRRWLGGENSAIRVAKETMSTALALPSALRGPKGVFLAILLLIGIVGTAIVSLRSDLAPLLIPSARVINDRIFYEDYLRTASTKLLLYGAGMVGIGLFGLMWAYLSGYFVLGRSNAAADVLSQREELRRLTAELRAQIESFKAGNAAQASGSQSASADASSDAHKLELRYADVARDASGVEQIRGVFDATRRRLGIEIAAVSRRATANLLIGFATTLGAIGVMAFAVLTRPTEPFKEWVDLGSHYVPWFAIVVFVEVFAFFFLRLYRATLAETRSYQDQLTDLALNQVPIEMGWLTEQTDANLALAKQMLGNAGKKRSPAATAAEFDVKTALELLKSTAEIAKKQKPASAEADK